jgi:putative ABC transport system ATP-binding protein
MTSPIIETHELVREYRLGGETVRALDGVSVTIDHGEFVAVIGSSGSGKSTFMNVLGCLDRPTSGTYLLDGEDVARLGDDALAAIRNAKLGFVFQHFNLLARTSARDNVELPLVYAGVKAEERHKRAEAKLRALALGERIHHMPSQLSGGQQQRVAIARALVNDPVLLLADEPTGALDTRTSYEIMGLFDELNRSGLTIVLVTHESDIAHFARRVITFRDGRVIGDEAVAKEAEKRALVDA